MSMEGSKVEVVVLSTYNSRPAGVPANGTLLLWYKRHGGTRLQGAVNGNGGHDQRRRCEWAAGV